MRSGTSRGRFEFGEKVRYLPFPLIGEGLKREAGDAAAVATLIHGVLYPGYARLGNNHPRSTRQNRLQFARLFVVTLPEQFEQRHAFFRKRARQRQYRSTRANRQRRIHARRGAD